MVSPSRTRSDTKYCTMGSTGIPSGMHSINCMAPVDGPQGGTPPTYGVNTEYVYLQEYPLKREIRVCGFQQGTMVGWCMVRIRLKHCRMAFQSATKRTWPCAGCHDLYPWYKLMESRRSGTQHEPSDSGEIRFWRVCVRCETGLRAIDFESWSNIERKSPRTIAVKHVS